MQNIKSRIVEILKANEEFLSDGYEFYCGVDKTPDDILEGIASEIERLLTPLAPDAPPESCEHGNLRGKCPVEICSYSKHGGRR